MAYQVTYWKSEGKSDVELLTTRIRAKIEAFALVDSFLFNRKRNGFMRDCKIITLDRTDRQSNIVHELWIAPDYIDLNERV